MSPQPWCAGGSWAKPGAPDLLLILGSPTEKFAVRYTLAHQTGQNQEPSFDGLNNNGKLRYSWAVDLGPFKPGW